jgi:hypothetical protein
MLGAHPDCICTPESEFMTDVLRVSADPGARLASIVADERFLPWEGDLDALRQELATHGGDYAESLLRIVRRYAASVGREGARVWIDHTPLNARVAATLLEMFPAARFIHIVRDGRAVAASVLPLTWGPNTVERSAHWWIELVAFGLALESWGRERVMRVRYEDLVGDPESTVRSLSAFTGLSFDPVMLRADGFRPPPDPVKQHALIGQPPRRDRARAWTTALTPRQIEIVEFVAGDLLRYLGYDVQFGLKARPPSMFEHWSGAIRERLSYFLISRWRNRRRMAQRRAIMEAERRGSRL